MFTNEFVKNTNANILFAKEDHRFMIKKMSQKLNALARLVASVLPATLRLRVVDGWVDTASDFTPPSSLAIKYEGREVGVTLHYPDTGEQSNFATAYSVLADLAWEVNFNFLFIEWTSASRTLWLSSVGEFCPSKVELAFLLDGSRSVTLPGYQRQLQFVDDLAMSFTLGGNESRIAVATFDGPIISHFSTWRNLSDCPRGTEFEGNGHGCMCPHDATCSGPQISPFNPSHGCGMGYFAMKSGTGVCPETEADQTAYMTDPTLWPDCKLRAYFTHSCGLDCECSALSDKAWAEADSARTHVLFRDQLTAPQLKTALKLEPDGSLVYYAGATHLSIGVKVVREQIFNHGNGMRLSQQGIPRVLVTFTDGFESLGFDPAAEIEALHARGVRTFAIGLGPGIDYHPTLKALSSHPVDRHFLQLTHPDALGSIVDELSWDLCTSPQDLVVGQEDEFTDFAQTGLQYFKLGCPEMTSQMIVHVTDAAGTVTHAYASYTVQNPTPYNNHAADVSGVAQKTLKVTKNSAAAPLFITVANMGSDGGSFKIVGWSVVFTQPLVEVETPEKPVPNSNNQPLILALKDTDMITMSSNVATGVTHWLFTLGTESEGLDLFQIDADTGAISLRFPAATTGINRDTKDQYRLRRYAQHRDLACLVGYQDVLVIVVDRDLRPVIANNGLVIRLNESIGRRVNKPGPARRTRRELHGDGQVLFTVEASSSVSGDTGAFTFEWDAAEPGNVGNAFFLDVTSGQVSVADATQLKYKTNPKFVLKIRARNSFGLSLPAIFTIALLPVIEPPYFKPAHPTVADFLPPVVVPLTTAVGEPFLSVPIFSDDLDHSAAGATCSLTAVDAAASAWFTATRDDLDEANADVRRGQCVVKIQATPSSGSYTVQLSVREEEAGDDVFLVITVTSSNEFAPKFSQSTYDISHSVFAPEDTTILVFQAPLLVDGDGHTVTCAITEDLSGNLDPDGTPSAVGNPIFTIEQPCTLLSRRVVVDAFGGNAANVDAAVHLRITATDAGDEPKVATTTVRIFLVNACARPNCDDTNGQSSTSCCRPEEVETVASEPGLPATDVSCPAPGYECACVTGAPDCPGQVDHCSNAYDACRNGGSCTNVETDALVGYQCSCLDGVTGDRCDIVANACVVPSPCPSTSTCERREGTVAGVLNDYQCICPVGFHGRDCSLHDDDVVNTCEVHQNLCQNGGTCQPATDPACDTKTNCPLDSFVCACPPGTSGDRCQFTTDSCAGQCTNGGTCSPTLDGGLCHCASGFFGPLCESQSDEEPDPCNSVICMSGTCTPYRTSANGPEDSFYCADCDPGYTGRYCHLKEGLTDHCATGCNNPLDSCVQVARLEGTNPGYDDTVPPTQVTDIEANGHVCECSQGCSGDRCELCTFQCEGSCSMGTCTASKSGGVCSCLDCASGTFCDIDACGSNGNCVAAVGQSFPAGVCKCTDPVSFANGNRRMCYAGSFCSRMFSGCPSNTVTCKTVSDEALTEGNPIGLICGLPGEEATTSTSNSDSSALVAAPVAGAVGGLFAVVALLLVLAVVVARTRRHRHAASKHVLGVTEVTNPMFIQPNTQATSSPFYEDLPENPDGGGLSNPMYGMLPARSGGSKRALVAGLNSLSNPQYLFGSEDDGYANLPAVGPSSGYDFVFPSGKSASYDVVAASLDDQNYRLRTRSSPGNGKDDSYFEVRSAGANDLNDTYLQLRETPAGKTQLGVGAASNPMYGLPGEAQYQAETDHVLVASADEELDGLYGNPEMDGPGALQLNAQQHFNPLYKYPQA